MAYGTITIDLSDQMDKAIKQIADLELALDAAIIQCNTLQKEIEVLEEENQILKQAMDTISGDWE